MELSNHSSIVLLDGIEKNKTFIKFSQAKEIVPACLVDIFLAMDGKLYPSLFFANTLTRYSVYFFKCVN